MPAVSVSELDFSLQLIYIKRKSAYANEMCNRTNFLLKNYTNYFVKFLREIIVIYFVKAVRIL